MHANPVERVRDANPVDNPVGLSIVDELITLGHAKLRIGRDIQDQIERTFDTARGFYARPLSEKRNFALPAFVEGYRDIGLEYSQQPDRPDLTESFSLWNRNRARTEEAGWPATCPLHTEMRQTIDMLTPLVSGLFQSMADRWAPGTSAPLVKRASYLQVNYYEPAQHKREMLQDGHEDGHLITVVTATGPGLEIDTGDGYRPVKLGADEMLLMPGSLLELMTGGMIPALYHQVKNSFLKEPRYSMMYFVNPESGQALEPWVRNERNAGVDIVEQANALPLKFGLPTLVDGTSGRGR
ncbi:MAG TPA: 2OG-Fe(II) oxygenase family protein [Dongiaceae bacterium]|jgi:isopenicillin N synthase-like dioxygenase|nr:2OG-Fe(II) oxygenase family protein [Dongiaceae bacterium]